MLKITKEIIVADVNCVRKAFLILFQNNGIESAYSKMLRARRQTNENRFFTSSIEHLPFSFDNFEDKAQFITNALLRAGNLEAENTHLRRRHSDSNLSSYYYEPFITANTYKISNSDRYKASYIGYILSIIQKRKPEKASVLMPDGSLKTIKLGKDIHPLLAKLNGWIKSKPAVPPVVFKNHCKTCQFEKNCIAFAESEDSISLLSNMPTAVQKKYASKGIFTIKQLSYLYKPRRRSKHWGVMRITHQYELQALAIRTKTIYTTKLMSLELKNAEIFLDIESVPESGFHYLIGVLVVSLDRQQHFSFWAEDPSQEKSIFMEFLNLVGSCPSAPIFHYGSYEKKVISELAARYGEDVERILERLINLNSYIYGRIYFPTRSNGLKELCKYLGCRWTDEGATGLDSIVWRDQYDKDNCAAHKRKLIVYNEEDCRNLHVLKGTVKAICSQNSAIEGIKAAEDKDQLLSVSGKTVVDDFSALIRSAHGSYEWSKISLKMRQKSKLTTKEVERTTRSKRALKINRTVRVPQARVCPNHKCKLRPSSLIADVVILDLVRTGLGIKKQVTRYWGKGAHCPKCRDRIRPPQLRAFGRGAAKYGHGIKAWITYQRLTMRLPFRKITQLLEDTFDIRTASGGTSALFLNTCTRYVATENKILKKMLRSAKIHVDETQVNISGEIQYIWVFTDGTNVIFRLTTTRDSGVAHKILDGYQGVLISDFFPGYDKIDCSQQKCWVHLIRDINDDLRHLPFDTEFEIFVIALRNLLLPIFEAVEKYGLKKRNLRKFQKHVDAFYLKHIVDNLYQSDATKKYVKRLVRYRDSLFVFLNNDSIPWNNNMAERALRHLAVQRKISGSFSAFGMANYLVLLGVMQTCRFQNKSFLDFLMSGEMDVNKFKGRKNIRGWAMT